MTTYTFVLCLGPLFLISYGLLAFYSHHENFLYGNKTATKEESNQHPEKVINTKILRVSNLQVPNLVALLFSGFFFLIKLVEKCRFSPAHSDWERVHIVEMKTVPNAELQFYYLLELLVALHVFAMLLPCIFIISIELLDKGILKTRLEYKRQLQGVQEQVEAVARKKEQDEVSWQNLMRRAHTAEERLLRYRSDLSAILELPLMVDMTNPIVRDAYRQLDRMQRLMAEHPPILTLEEQVEHTPLALSVQRFEDSLHAAETEAASAREAWSRAERARYRRATLLWNIASNPAATTAERDTATRKCQAMLSELVELPEELVISLDAYHGHLALTA